MRWRGSDERPGTTARSRVAARAAPPQAGHHPRAGAGGAPDRAAAALATRGRAAHPGGCRDRRPRSDQPAPATQSRQLPCAQEPGRFRRRGLVDPDADAGLRGLAGTGKSHLLIGAGLRAVEQGLRVRYATAADLVEQLYRGLADNTVSRVIDGLLRNDVLLLDEVGFAPLDETGTQLLFRLVAAAYERRSLGLVSHWPFEDWGTFLPIPSTAAALLDRLLHHAIVVVTSGESWRLKEARSRVALGLRHLTPGPDTNHRKED